MRGASHLMRRGAMFWFRFRVPSSAQAVLGRTEIRRSLFTSCHREAKRRAAACFVRISIMCENAHAMNEQTPEEISAQLGKLFLDLVAKTAHPHALSPGAIADGVAIAMHAQVTPADAAGPPSISLAEALAKFRAEKEESWAAKTLQDVKLVHPWIVEHFGAHTPLRSIKKAQAASFREGALRLKKHSAASTFADRQTDDVAQRISARTASKYLDFAVAFFNWAASEAGLIEHSPCSRLTIKFSRKKSKAAAAATAPALRDIFMSPLFQGHHPLKPWQKGPVVTRGDYYWAFVLQFYFGTRIGEIAQLRVRDIATDADVPYAHIRTTDDDGNLINGNTLKTANAHRKVPICDDLIALGFLDFVKRQRANNAYLLRSIAPSRGQSSSSKASKFAARYLERVGQKNAGKATHWLRHALANALRAARTPDYTLNQILGHAQDAMHAQYGTVEDVGAAKDAIDNADWKFNPRAVLLRSKPRWTW